MFFALYTLLTPAGCGPPEAAPDPAEPDGRTPLLLISLDTTRADRLGAYGYAAADTPNLDALAARGARFASAWSPTPLTIPAHATLHTGLYPPHHGVRDNGDQRLSGEALTLAERLSAAGYTCHAVTAAYVTAGTWGFDQGFAVYKDALGLTSDRLSWRAERPADAVVDEAIASLGAGVDCLWVHLFDAHAPYAPPEPYASAHPGRPYDGELAWVDAQLGRLLAAAPAGALIAAVGDHGEGLGEGGEAQHGLLLTPGALRVPLILAGPGIEPAVIERPVSLADLYPTLLRLLGLPAAGPSDGRDLFGPDDRPGIYAESRYGYYHFGWSPLSAVITASGMLVRGTRDEGGAPPEAAAMMQSLADSEPLWAAAPATLGLGEVERLMALGYAAQPAPAPAGAGGDPRDGLALLGRLRALGPLPLDRRVEGLRALLDEAPELREARVQLGLSLAASGRLEEGIAEVVEAWRQRPDSTLAVILGQLWLQGADPAEALGWYGEALSRDPASLAARAGEVSALARLGRLDEAAARADRLLEEAPDHAELLLARAELALAAGEPVRAYVAPLSRLADERPEHPQALATAGRVLWAAGDLEGAEAALTEALRRRPANLAARLDLAALLGEQGRWVGVVKALRPLVNLEPEAPRWRAMTAAAYLTMDRPDLAAPHLAACAGHPLCPE